mgnify:CR=1 FL=1
MQVEEGERFLMSKEEMANKIATLTGGRAAEEIIFHSITTGASNDIEQATKLARAMITRYGMSDTFDMVAMETVANQYLGGDSSLSCSPETQNPDRYPDRRPCKKRSTRKRSSFCRTTCPSFMKSLNTCTSMKRLQAKNL